MVRTECQRRRAGLTLLELLCVIAIILVLAGLLLGPAARVLQRVRADKWGEECGVRIVAIVQDLRKACQGQQDFPAVTLERIQKERLVGPLELEFLKDPRVTLLSFAGSEPDDKVILRVEVRRGFFTEAGIQTVTKAEITALK